MTDGTVALGDTTIAYADEGEGTPLVLVHGTTQDRTAWVFVGPMLQAAGYRTIAVEMPGSGQTTDAGGPLELEAIAAQVVAVADHLGLDRFGIVGYSLGAEVAAVVAAGNPSRVTGAALVCGWLKSDLWMHAAFDLWQRLFQADKELFARFLVVEGLSPTFHTMLGGALEASAADTAGTLAPGSDRQAELDGRVDLSEVAPTISVPTLAVAGKVDRIVPLDHVEALAAAIPGATLAVLDGGHALPVEAAGPLVEALTGFFGGL